MLTVEVGAFGRHSSPLKLSSLLQPFSALMPTSSFWKLAWHQRAVMPWDGVRLRYPRSLVSMPFLFLSRFSWPSSCQQLVCRTLLCWSRVSSYITCAPKSVRSKPFCSLGSLVSQRNFVRDCSHIDLQLLFWSFIRLIVMLFFIPCISTFCGGVSVIIIWFNFTFIFFCLLLLVCLLLVVLFFI